MISSNTQSSSAKGDENSVTDSPSTGTTAGSGDSEKHRNFTEMLRYSEEERRAKYNKAKNLYRQGKNIKAGGGFSSGGITIFFFVMLVVSVLGRDPALKREYDRGSKTHKDWRAVPRRNPSIVRMEGLREFKNAAVKRKKDRSDNNKGGRLQGGCVDGLIVWFENDNPSLTDYFKLAADSPALNWFCSDPLTKTVQTSTSMYDSIVRLDANSNYYGSGWCYAFIDDDAVCNHDYIDVRAGLETLDSPVTITVHALEDGGAIRVDWPWMIVDAPVLQYILSPAPQDSDPWVYSSADVPAGQEWTVLSFLEDFGTPVNYLNVAGYDVARVASMLGPASRRLDAASDPAEEYLLNRKLLDPGEAIVNLAMSPNVASFDILMPPGEQLFLEGGTVIPLGNNLYRVTLTDTLAAGIQWTRGLFFLIVEAGMRVDVRNIILKPGETSGAVWAQVERVAGDGFDIVATGRNFVGTLVEELGEAEVPTAWRMAATLWEEGAGVLSLLLEEEEVAAVAALAVAAV